MRGLARYVRRSFRESGTLELTDADLSREEHAAPGQAGGADRARLEDLAREVGQVADYVRRLKREIAALKAGEVYSKRIPATVTDLRSVHDATKSAADTIMAAAEAILERDPSDPTYEAAVGDCAVEIMQACSFQDLAGQRLDRAIETLGEFERRLERFAKAVKISDAELFDRKAILRDARREVLMVEGPQESDAAIKQDAIDKLFG